MMNPVKPSQKLKQEAGACMLLRDGLGVLCFTKPVAPAAWKLSAFWPLPPCVDLKHFPVAGERGEADQAALEADKTLFALEILSGTKMWLNCFYILSVSMCCGAARALGNWYH